MHAPSGRKRAKWMAVMYWRIRKALEERAALQIQRLVRGRRGREIACRRRRLYEKKIQYELFSLVSRCPQSVPCLVSCYRKEA